MAKKKSLKQMTVKEYIDSLNEQAEVDDPKGMAKRIVIDYIIEQHYYLSKSKMTVYKLVSKKWPGLNNNVFQRHWREAEETVRQLVGSFEIYKKQLENDLMKLELLYEKAIDNNDLTNANRTMAQILDLKGYKDSIDLAIDNNLEITASFGSSLKQSNENSNDPNVINMIHRWTNNIKGDLNMDDIDDQGEDE